jgi:hypothetical protein
MPEHQERRAAPRIPLANRPDTRVPGLREGRLLDLSVAGAQIAHLDPLKPGGAFTLELPPPGRRASFRPR